MSPTPPRLRPRPRTAAAALGLAGLVLTMSGCASHPPPEDYTGETIYASGTAEITEPLIQKENARSFDGLRLAGPRSDVDPAYWDGELVRFGTEVVPLVGTFEVDPDLDPSMDAAARRQAADRAAEARVRLRAAVRVFEEFEQRYVDCQVYDTQSADAVLSSFRIWTRRRGLEDAFLSFWADREA